MRKKLLAACFVFLIQIATEVYANSDFPTYFSYSPEEIQELRTLRSDYTMSKNNLKKWDLNATKGIEENRLSYLKSVRIFTYLYVAQKEAAYLSYQVHGNFMGSLDPISNSTLSLFLPQISNPSYVENDPYSRKLSEIVFAKIKERVERENESPDEFKVPDDLLRNKETSYSEGIFVAKWIPWYTCPAIAYWAVPPPSNHDSRWQVEISKIKKTQFPMTDEKKEAIQFWAGLTEKGSGDWRVIANNFLFSHDVPFSKMLQVRSVLMIGIYDGSIVCFGGKYHFSRIRPKIYDRSIKYMIKHPNHPSYPSGHSTESTIASSILSHYFPEEADQWNHLAEEARISRIWAGIHYPIDDRAGVESGKKVAEKVLEEEEKNSSGSSHHCPISCDLSCRSIYPEKLVAESPILK